MTSMCFLTIKDSVEIKITENNMMVKIAICGKISVKTNPKILNQPFWGSKRFLNTIQT